MIERNEIWDKVKEKQEELRALLDENWKNGEYHIATIGEQILRTADESIEASEHMLDVTNHFIGSVEKLQKMIMLESTTVRS